MSTEPYRRHDARHGHEASDRKYGSGVPDESPGLWRGTLADYLECVRTDPTVAEGAHARLYRMIERAGRREGGEDGPYQFFADDLFGLGPALEALVEDYLHPAALGLDVRRRLLLLMGPVSGGKSTLVWLLKRGLEAFTATEAGRVYALSGCPMHEDPLHALPPGLRAEVSEQLGISIAGELCPLCRLRFEREWRTHPLEAPVERIVFSEARRVGIGTFVPADPKSQDMADLTGSVDFSTITTYGSEADPRAFRFDGELYRANRGLMEFQEMLKLDEKFLYHLLGLTQEGTFKAGRFALIHADQVVVGHTNESEFKAFAHNPRNEALLSRMVVVRVPYPLSVRAEAAIYRKLLSASPVTRTVHFGPGSLEAAASVSVLSRLGPSERPGLDPLTKLAVLNREHPQGLTPEDVDVVQSEARDEGMTGIDPRYVVNRLASAVIRRRAPCITAVDVLRALRDGAGQHGMWSRESRSDLEHWVNLARQRYDRQIRDVVEQAYLEGQDENGRAVFHAYLDQVETSLWPNRRLDPVSGQRVEPNEDLLHAIEDGLGITDLQRRSFREEVFLRVSAAGRREAWDHRIHPELQKAVEDRLFSDLRDLVKMHLATPPDAEAEAKIEVVAERLLVRGFCAHCAREAVLYVGTLLGR